MTSSSSEPASTTPESASSRKILAATGLALVAAAVLLATAVMPAQYGLDPLGVGGALAINGLFRASGQPITAQPTALQHDSIDFVLGPYQFVEYKYWLEAGASMVFSWSATRSVNYDLHGEPENAPAGYAESFDRRESDKAHGTYRAPFSGTHGWYWENGGAGDVTIRLTTAGFYREPREYFDGNIIPRRLTGFSGRQAPG